MSEVQPVFKKITVLLWGVNKFIVQVKDKLHFKSRKIYNKKKKMSCYFLGWVVFHYEWDFVLKSETRQFLLKAFRKHES